MSKPTQVVIIGGGFAGLNAAKVLAKDRSLAVILLDRRNHHLFQPLLYQVAMAGLSPADIAVPIRSIFARQRNVSVYLADVKDIDFAKQEVVTNIGVFPYDYCISACGAFQSYFGNESWEPFAPGLKTIEQATEIRRRVLMAFERAESTTDRELQRYFLTFVVVGGGPTGVELAGAIGEISKYTLDRDFRRIDPNQTRIILIEGGKQILPSFSKKLSRKAARGLEQLGVQIWTSSTVTKVSKEGVMVGSEFLKAKTVLWAAGVGPTPLTQHLKVEKDPKGRVSVNPDLSICGQSKVFCLGDQASFNDPKYGVLPGLAPVAIQQGNFVAKLIRAEVADPTQARPAFHYFDKGQLATIGRRRAVLQTSSVRSYGFFAWLVWLFVHIHYLIGFRNRFFVFWQWAWHYMSYSRGARLIVHKNWRLFSKTNGEASTSRGPTSYVAS